MKSPTDWGTFSALEIRVGTIISAEHFPEAKKPAFKLIVDFGASGIKKSSAQITALYRPEQLIGTQVIAVANFPPKQIGNFMSECLVLGAVNEDGTVVLIQPERAVKPGTEIG